MTIWRRVDYRQMKVVASRDAFAGKPRSYRYRIPVGTRLAREEALKTNKESVVQRFH